MKNIIATVAIIALLVPASVSAYLYFSEPDHAISTASIPAANHIVSNKAQNLKSSAMNAAIDATGIKDEVDQALRENAPAIASSLGMQEDEVNASVDALNIKGWKASKLPSGAISSDSYDVNWEGRDFHLSTYENEPYVTISAYGQDITFSVPDSARDSFKILTPTS